MRLHDGEDGRYAALRREWGADAPARFFRLYVAQAVAATLCSVPGLAAMRGGPLDAWAFAGAAVWLVAVAGESVADAQLVAMKKLGGLVAREAAVMSMNDAFLAMSGVFALALLLMPLLKKSQAGGGADAH